MVTMKLGHKKTVTVRGEREEIKTIYLSIHPGPKDQVAPGLEPLFEVTLNILTS